MQATHRVGSIWSQGIAKGQQSDKRGLPRRANHRQAARLELLDATMVRTYLYAYIATADGKPDRVAIDRVMPEVRAVSRASARNSGSYGSDMSGKRASPGSTGPSAAPPGPRRPP